MEKKPNGNKVKIYKAARKLFSRHDFDEVNVRMICSEAGVSIGTFYHYYPSKYDFTSIFYDHLDEYAIGIKQKVENGDCAAVEKVVSYFALQGAYIAEGNNINDTMALLLIHVKHPSIDIYSHDRVTYTYVLDLLRECQEEGSLPESLSREMLADFLFAAFRGLLIDWRANGRSYSLGERAKLYASAVLRAYTTR
ncbi:MAG: TetR/AcrR family transcriptional regulator [Synergistaceae bacterium]|nr:TetR/AcrR family transcriptional regulator [Synergistaceae bacterium]